MSRVTAITKSATHYSVIGPQTLARVILFAFSSRSRGIPIVLQIPLRLDGTQATLGIAILIGKPVASVSRGSGISISWPVPTTPATAATMASMMSSSATCFLRYKFAALA